MSILFGKICRNNASTPDIAETFNNYYLNAFHPNTDFNLVFDFQLTNDTVGSRVFSDVDYVYPKMDSHGGGLQTIGYVPLNFEALKKDLEFLMLKSIGTPNYFIMQRLMCNKLIIKEVIRRIERELE